MALTHKACNSNHPVTIRGNCQDIFAEARPIDLRLAVITQRFDHDQTVATMTVLCDPPLAKPLFGPVFDLPWALESR